MDHETLLQDFQDRVGWLVGGGLLHYRLVHGRVERLVLGFDGRDAVAAQDVQELSLHQSNTLNQRPRLARLLGGGGGPVEVIQHGQQVLGERAVPVLAFLLEIALHPLLVVLEVGLGALQEIQELAAFLLGRLGPRPQGLEIAGYRVGFLAQLAGLGLKLIRLIHDSTSLKLFLGRLVFPGNAEDKVQLAGSILTCMPETLAILDARRHLDIQRAGADLDA